MPESERIAVFQIGDKGVHNGFVLDRFETERFRESEAGNDPVFVMHPILVKILPQSQFFLRLLRDDQRIYDISNIIGVPAFELISIVEKLKANELI